MHKFLLNRIDISLLVPAILIIVISLATFYSVDTYTFQRQLLFLFFSLFAYVVFLNIDYRIFAYYSKYLYIAMIASLLFLFFLGIEARGSVRWVDFFGIRIQFSEIIKPFFVILIAQYLTSNESRSFGKFLKTLLLLAPIFFLILKQPDLGSAMIYFFVTFFMLFMYGFPLRYFLGVGFLGILPLPLIYELLHDYQRQRIISFINPSSDPLGSSYNAVQALISVGSGGFAGKGFGHGTQSILNFLPEHHTDFIFATISENLGFLGALVLLSLYCFLLYRIYKISLTVHDSLPHLILMGFYFLFLTHVFLNIGMNIGIVPIVGITLPFASYGGSSLLTNFIILGIISSIEFDYKKTHSIEIR